MKPKVRFPNFACHMVWSDDGRPAGTIQVYAETSWEAAQNASRLGKDCVRVTPLESPDESD